MKNSDLHLNVTQLTELGKRIIRHLSVYRAFIFFLAVATLYGYIVWRINVFSNTPASTSEETAQATAQPRIDPATVKKIQSLQDNSVSVQSLFDTARQNPFQE